MGLIVSVYRHGADCTNGGISADHDRLVVVNIDGPFKSSEKNPPVLLIQHPAGDQYGQLLVPAVEGDGTDEWVPLVVQGTNRMFGGNYASGDSRWAAATQHGDRIVGQLVAIHDRFER